MNEWRGRRQDGRKLARSRIHILRDIDLSSDNPLPLESNSWLFCDTHISSLGEVFWAQPWEVQR